MSRTEATIKSAGGWSAPPPVVTPRLRLRDFTEADFDAVHRYASDPRVTATLCWGPNSPGQTRAFLATAVMEAAAEPRSTYNLGIEETTEGEIIGGIGIQPRGDEPAAFELGYCLRPDYWGAGLATEAVAAITAFGFQRLAANLIVAEVFVSNAASGRVLEKLGFRAGHTFQRHVTCRDEDHDSRQFTLDRQAWRQTRAE
jgi:RimJ/RimL family protein N-acetyltransferase